MGSCHVQNNFHLFAADFALFSIRSFPFGAGDFCKGSLLDPVTPVEVHNVEPVSRRGSQCGAGDTYDP